MCSTAVPVQSGLTEYVPVPGCHSCAGGKTTHDDVVDLCDIAFTIVVLHDHAADRQVRAQEYALQSESVVARKCSV